MRRILIVLIPLFFSFSSYSQFGGLLDKVKNKVAKKLAGQTASKDSTAGSTPAKDGSAPSGDAATTDEGANNNQQEANTARSTRNGAPAAPKPPVYPVTGRMLKATTATYTIDRSNMGQGDPALAFSVFFSSYDYIMTNDFIRAEVSKRDTSGGASIGGSLVEAFAPGAVTLVDIRAKKSYAIANYMGIITAAVEDDISGYQDAMGLTAYFKKYMESPDLRLQSLGATTFHGYHATAVRMEIPVKPTTDEHGKKSDQLLYLHSMLNGNFSPMEAGSYDPSYKLYLETYYTHDLDGKIPPAITSDKNILHVAGFYIGSVLKDEKGHKVTYAIRSIDPNTQIDAGMFSIPLGCEKLTHAQFDQRIKEKLTGGR